MSGVLLPGLVLAALLNKRPAVQNSDEQRHLTCMMVDLAGQNYVFPLRVYCNHHSENKITVKKKKATAAQEVNITAVLAGVDFVL
jgi:hypothetical protein